jgi:hypothetical protein
MERARRIVESSRIISFRTVKKYSGPSVGIVDISGDALECQRTVVDWRERELDRPARAVRKDLCYEVIIGILCQGLGLI